MFNAVNIVEALKNYIHSKGGVSNADNIAEAVNDLNSIPGQGSSDIPPELTNAIETGGIGWTNEEVVSGLDIYWDGNTEGLIRFGSYYKVSNDSISIEDFDINKMVVEVIRRDDEAYVCTAQNGLLHIDQQTNHMITIKAGPGAYVLNIPEDFEQGGMSIHKGIYFTSDVYWYVSRFYQGDIIVPVTHNIDEKYMPDQITNAIETGGIGWTETITEEGFDIQWDGDSEGLEQVDLLYKVSDAPLTKEQLIDSELVLHIENPEEDIEFVITESEIRSDFPGVYLVFPDPTDEVPIAISVLEDFASDEVFNINRGLYFYREEYDGYVNWVSKLSKESVPVETVHRIDEKYVPSTHTHDMDIVAINIEPGEDEFTFTIDRTTEEARALSDQGKIIVFNFGGWSAISFPYWYTAEGQFVDYEARIVAYSQIEFTSNDWRLHTGEMYYDDSELDYRNEWTQV